VGAERILRRLRELLDVDTSGAAVGDSLVLDVDGETWVAGTVASGSSDAADVTVTPAGGIASTNVQDALEELDAEKAAASHVHAGEEITSGTVADARIAATIARDSEVTAAVAAHTGDTSDAHDASAVSVIPFGAIAATDVQSALEELASEAVTGAPTGADYLVGTAQGALSAEIVVGTSPGGELGGTWASPTVDATHSGSSHAGVQAAAEATAAAALDAHVTDATDAHDATAISTVPAGNLAATNVQTSLAELDSEKAATSHAHAGEDITSGTVADARIASTIARDSEVSSAIATSESGQVRDGDAAGGVLGGTYPNPSFAADMATQAELDAHVNDTADAHDASAVSITDDMEIFSTLNVQAALEFLYTNYISALSTNLGDHINDTADAHDASAISVLDAAGFFASADVEGALAEVNKFPYVSRSSDTILTAADRGKAIVATDAFTQTFTAAATLGAGWWVFYFNAAVGTTVTLDPVQTIDGAASMALLPGYSSFVFSTGSEFVTIPVVDERRANSIDADSDEWYVGDTVQEVLVELGDHSARHENGGADEISISGLDGTSTELAAHIADTTDAHDASAISVNSATLVGTGTDAQAVFEELDNSIDTLRTASINYIIDGGGATITTGVKGDLVIDFACVIQSATLLADQSGSIVVNVWKDTYANYPPVVGDKITASAPPTISSATKSQDSTLTGWTTSIAAGDTLRFNVDSVTTIQRVTLVLKVLRTV
jgi:hypothetical protein